MDTGFNTCLRGETNQRLPTVRGIIFYCHVFSKHVTIRGIEPGIIPHSNQGSSIVVLKVFLSLLALLAVIDPLTVVLTN